MSYATGSHTVFHHRYHIVWITKYRYKVLEGALQEQSTISSKSAKNWALQIVLRAYVQEHVICRGNSTAYRRQRLRATGQRTIVSSRANGVS